MLALTHACTTANASVNYRMYVPQRPSNVPIAPMGKLLTCLLRLACTTAADAPVNSSVVISDVYVLQRPEMFPSPRWENCAPMGDSRIARCLQGGGVSVWGGTVSIVNSQIYSNTATACVRAHLQKFPSPPWETHILLIVCREAVSTSLPARSR